MILFVNNCLWQGVLRRVGRPDRLTTTRWSNLFKQNISQRVSIHMFILLLESPCLSVPPFLLRWSLREEISTASYMYEWLAASGAPVAASQIYVFWQLLPPVSTGKKTHEGGQGGRGSGVGGPELGVQGRGPGGGLEVGAQRAPRLLVYILGTRARIILRTLTFYITRVFVFSIVFFKNFLLSPLPRGDFAQAGMKFTEVSSYSGSLVLAMIFFQNKTENLSKDSLDKTENHAKRKLCKL